MKNGKLIFLQSKYNESDNSNKGNFDTLILILIIVKIPTKIENIIII